MSIQPSAVASARSTPAQPQATLFSPYTLGDIPLHNRLVLSPMTRSRALDGNVANPLAATYYVQRASAGLMITEGTQVSPQGVGYIRTPGIHSPEQVAGWKHVTDAVHRVGGTIFAQLWHVGRVSHPDFHGGALPVAPSALPVEGEAFTSNGKVKIPTPRALETGEIRGIIAQFRKGAENAKAAGFDGVELHGANGYLLDQFLRDGANQRTDAYGGSLTNRARLPLEVAEAVTEVFGASRVGYKLSPYFPRLLDVGLQSDCDLQLYREGTRQAWPRLSARVGSDRRADEGRRHRPRDAIHPPSLRRRADRERRL